MSGLEGASTLRTNLIIYHSIADILDQAAQLVCVLGTVQEPRNLASPFQRDEVSKNTIQFPSRPHVSD